MEIGPSYEELFRWAREHSYWQWDALRRIVDQGEVDDVGIAELVALAKASGAPESPEPPPPRLGILENASTPSPVSITKIHSISRVNALSPGPISFRQSGLTIIYGKNASGKSGVTKILKKTCRAADPGGRILPSYHEQQQAHDVASATLEFAVDGRPETFVWREDGPENQKLRTIHVFDLPSALSLVDKPNRLDYSPEIIQTLRMLLRAIERVCAKLEEEKGLLGPRFSSLANLLSGSGTVVAKQFRAISASTTPETVRAITTFSEENKSRLDLLDGALRDDRIQAARTIEERTRQLRAAKRHLSEALEQLDDTALTHLEHLRCEASAARDAAELARSVVAERSELPEVGNAAWRTLWEAARTYSEQSAYPTRGFPAVDDARCVLCQQLIEHEARTRLRAFENFVTSDTQQGADSAAWSLEIAIAGLRSLRLPRSWVVAELLGLERQSAGWLRVKQFIVTAHLRKRRALRRQPFQLAFQEQPELDSAIASLEAQAQALRRAAGESERAEMKQERDELADLQTLSSLASTIQDEIDRLKSVRKLDALIQQCDTGRITRKARETARTIITGRLGAAFARNLAALGFDTTGIGISLGDGERAVHPWTMQLMERPDIEPTGILSEGERTCVALAGFLAEIEASGNRSGIVLDDPVTSLDHKYRDKVAKRLVAEAKDRQVVVFTHEIVFLYELRKHSTAASLAPHELSLERGYRKHGVVKQGPPWIALSVSRRLRQLRDELRRAQDSLSSENREEYELIGERIYKRLRQTWERAIEEVLLAQVVQRFNTDVQTKRLRYLADISESDVRTVEREMAYCSDFVHDEAGPRTIDIPEPSTIEADLERLESWLTAVEQRRKKV